MKGTVLGFDVKTGQGAIAGDDGRRYAFAATEWRGGATIPDPSAAVDFEIAGTGDAAMGVYPLPVAAARTYPGQVVGQPLEKSHIAAGLLALFLGAWGVHKFYLGYATEGAILLGATLVSFVLCFILIGFLGLMVIGTICFVEAIIYLTKTEAEFQAVYVQGRRPWF